jgi:hypothetical protein
MNYDKSSHRSGYEDFYLQGRDVMHSGMYVDIHPVSNPRRHYLLTAANSYMNEVGKTTSTTKNRKFWVWNRSHTSHTAQIFWASVKPFKVRFILTGISPPLHASIPFLYGHKGKSGHLKSRLYMPHNIIRYTKYVQSLYKATDRRPRDGGDNRAWDFPFLPKTVLYSPLPSLLA